MGETLDILVARDLRGSGEHGLHQGEYPLVMARSNPLSDAVAKYWMEEQRPLEQTVPRGVDLSDVAPRWVDSEAPSQ